MSFNKQLYDENDARAKKKATDFLSRRFVVKEGTQYGIDLICYRDNVIRYYVEVEVKNLWIGQEFPWSEVNVLTRKEKFFREHDKVIFIMFNTDLSSCFIMDNTTILASPKVEVPNRRHASGEYFFKVPYNKIIHHRNI
jgi:hypothetical protein